MSGCDGRGDAKPPPALPRRTNVKPLTFDPVRSSGAAWRVQIGLVHRAAMLVRWVGGNHDDSTHTIFLVPPRPQCAFTTHFRWVVMVTQRILEGSPPPHPTDRCGRSVKNEVNDEQCQDGGTASPVVVFVHSSCSLCRAVVTFPTCSLSQWFWCQWSQWQLRKTKSIAQDLN